MSGSPSDSISLQPLMVEELSNDIKAPTHDNISMKVIEQSFEDIVQPLVTISVSHYLLEYVFPESLKIAKVIPVFIKADDPTLFSNYRPISIPPAFFKLFEKVIFNRLFEFLDLHSIFYSKQFGFRNNHSTALIDLICKLYVYRQLLAKMKQL